VAEPLIAVPDDFPSVFEGSAAHDRAKKIGETRVVSARGADEEAELIKRIGRARVAINIRAHARFTDGVFAACRDLKMVSIWGTGTDNIDLEAAGRRGVTICNTPGVNAFAVAEHAIALMLTTGRRIPKIDREMRGGAWPREMLTQCLGKTLGVFGTGTIGARVVTLAKALGMEVLAWSARGDEGRIRSLGRRPGAKEEILKQADFVSLHLRLTPETRGFLTRREMALMKKTAILINTGRGALVERDALLEALTAGPDRRRRPRCLPRGAAEARRPGAGAAQRGALAPQRRPDARGDPRRTPPRGDQPRELPQRSADRRGRRAAEVADAVPAAVAPVAAWPRSRAITSRSCTRTIDSSRAPSPSSSVPG
jgi:D-3-phosphoglycerate dehydrogenase